LVANAGGYEFHTGRVAASNLSRWYNRRHRMHRLTNSMRDSGESWPDHDFEAIAPRKSLQAVGDDRLRRSRRDTVSTTLRALSEMAFNSAAIM